MAAVTVSKKGWVVIPKEIRDRFGIRPGDKLHILDVGGRITVIPVHKDPIAAGWGLLKGGSSMTEELIEEHRREVEDDKREARKAKSRDG